MYCRVPQVGRANIYYKFQLETTQLISQSQTTDYTPSQHFATENMDGNSFQQLERHTA